MTETLKDPEGAAARTLLFVLLRGARRFRYLVVTAAVAGLCVGVFRGLVTPNQYTSSGKLFVKPGVRDSVSAEAALTTDGTLAQRISGAREAVLTELQVLSSPQLFDKVVEKLGADVVLAPYDPASESQEGVPWHTAMFHSFQSWWFASGAATPSTDFAVDQSKLASVLLSRLVSIAPEPGASVITVSFTSHSPERARQIVDYTLDAALQLHSDVFERMASIDKMETEAKAAESAALEAAKKLREFKLERQIYDFDQQRQEAWTDLLEIDRKLEALALDTKRREAERDAQEVVKAAIPATRTRSGSTTVQLSPDYTALVTILSSLYQERLRLERAMVGSSQGSLKAELDLVNTQITDYERRVKSESKELQLSGVSEDNPDFLLWKQKMADITIDLKSFEAQRAELSSRKTAKLAAFKVLEDQTQELRRLELDESQKRQAADKLRSVVNTQRAVQRLDQANLSSVSIMQSGSFEADKVGPRRGQMVVYGVVMGVFGGLALAAALTLLDRRVRVREDLVRLALPTEGVLDSTQTQVAQGGWALPPSLAECREDIARFWTSVPFDRRATAGLRIAFVPCGLGANVGRAAATFAIGLAAHGGEKVLYVASTEGTTWLAQRLGVQAKLGWSEVLRGEGSLEDAATPTSVTGLSYLSAGEVGGIVPHPMASQAFLALLDRAATRYRFVVIELPDLGVMSEGRSVLGIADAAEIIVCKDKGTKASVRAAVAAVRATGTRLLGGVLQLPESAGARRSSAT